ncbi:fimbrial protein [Prevotella sp.]|uniref:fimbrial protein n=1 Tax=Prevotella sp. TaxID=59823 RepID=UPI0026483E89|nr:fimbrial protein [Prevotella sp.]MDN5554401.1 fimbrial protein [Prevotella sp.]
MKGLKIKIQALLLCGVLITGLFSSCASDENIDNGNKVNAGDKVLTLTLNTPKATTTCGAKTRVTNTDGTGSAENQINRLTIGIFASDGSVRTIQEITSGSTPAFTTASNITTATITTNSLAAHDSVFVAVNAPVGTFNGVLTKDAFLKTIEIDAALTTKSDGTSSGNAEAMDNIPMFGKCDVAASGTHYTADLSVSHLLAKITLAKITVAFDPTGSYSAATFQPTSYFLINVPNYLRFYDVGWGTGSTTTLWHGWADATSSSNPANTAYKEYLGTGPLATQPVLTGTSTFLEPKNVFYTIPTSDATGVNNTKLVICGLFSPDGTSDAKKTVYYPVNINYVTSTQAAAEGTAKRVYANKNYTCNVTIKTKGADTPTANLDPNDIDVKVTVTGFVNIDQDTTFE